jgi:acyl-CoA hydrolase
MKLSTSTEIETTIGRHIAGLVEDGATLQMGIGAIPDAVLAQLGDHKGLGIHTEMFSDGMVDLFYKGAITGEYKRRDRGKIVAGFVMGTQKTYDFVDQNPIVSMKDIAYVNDTSIIRQNPKVTAINSAIEVDITGQVCSDTIGTRVYSGFGGQLDFVRGAALSPGGKPIIALPSVTGKGESRIVSLLKPGAGVVTTRAHAHYIVTEYGVAFLFGKNLRERAKSLIDISHPLHREKLTQDAYDRFKIL